MELPEHIKRHIDAQKMGVFCPNWIKTKENKNMSNKYYSDCGYIYTVIETNGSVSRAIGKKRTKKNELLILHQVTAKDFRMTFASEKQAIEIYEAKIKEI